MAENGWLLAENDAIRFAVPAEAVSEMVSGAEITDLPFSGEHVSGIFIHAGKAVPVYLDAEAGFGRPSGDLVLLDLKGELLALPVRKIAGFSGPADVEDAGGTPIGPCRGTIRVREKNIAAVRMEDLYKRAGFI